MLLVGDIGGTNTRFVVADSVAKEINLLFEKTYPSAEFDSFDQVVGQFFSEHDIGSGIDTACFAIAGPVESGVADVTNLPWVINEHELRERLQIGRVNLINDFVAVAYGIFELKDNDLIVLQQGAAKEEKLLSRDAAIIGAGTGLGVSHLIWQDHRYRPFSSEAGHVGFSPENRLQCELLAWMQKKHSHVSLEMLLSGPGLVSIYHFFSEVVGLAESSTAKKAMQEMDPAVVITELAERGDNLCQQVLNCFIDIYGAAAGNVALHYYPIKEIYIAGGIAAKIKEKMLNGRFIDAFVAKGVMRTLLEKVAIKLVIQEKVGLLGALAYARSRSG